MSVNLEEDSLDLPSYKSTTELADDVLAYILYPQHDGSILKVEPRVATCCHNWKDNNDGDIDHLGAEGGRSSH